MPVTRDDLTTTGLAEALRAQARGLYAAEASVELLIEHGSWLRRPDFLEHVEIFPGLVDESRTFASIDWEHLARADLPASSGELRILQIAAGLAGNVTRDPLAELLASLDDVNLTIVLRAILHASRGAGGPVVSVEPFYAQ